MEPIKIEIGKPAEKLKAFAKSFGSFRANTLHLKFPNGNTLSSIWGYGSCSENYDSDGERDAFLQSETVEIMFFCGEDLKKSLCGLLGGSNPIGHIDMAKWLCVVNLLANEKKGLD